MFASFTLILSMSALFSYINHKFLKLPTTIGLMLLALITAVFFLAIEGLAPDAYSFFCQIVLDIDFKTVLLDVMLSMLLFAGAMHVNIKDLQKETRAVVLFSTLGVLISTFLVGGGIFLASQLVGVELPFIYALLFRALISPTDPIAVLAILKAAGVQKSLELKIEGESLFNDGIGVVVFITILGLAMPMETGEFGVGEILQLFAEEAIGGLVYGLVLGYLGWQLLKTIDDDPKIDVLITLALALGGYSLASILHVSGPLAMEAAGLLVGNRVNSSEFSQKSENFLETFWDMLDDILNGILFVLIGLVIFTLQFEWNYFLLGLLAIPIVLLARFISVGIPFSLLKESQNSWIKPVGLLTWGGLRGGISVALALSLSEAVMAREAIIFITYSVVVFSILVQGLTLKALVKWISS